MEFWKKIKEALGEIFGKIGKKKVQALEEPKQETEIVNGGTDSRRDFVESVAVENSISFVDILKKHFNVNEDIINNPEAQTYIVWHLRDLANRNGIKLGENGLVTESQVQSIIDMIKGNKVLTYEERKHKIEKNKSLTDAERVEADKYLGIDIDENGNVTIQDIDLGFGAQSSCEEISFSNDENGNVIVGRKSFDRDKKNPNKDEYLRNYDKSILNKDGIVMENEHITYDMLSGDIAFHERTVRELQYPYVAKRICLKDVHDEMTDKVTWYLIRPIAFDYLQVEASRQFSTIEDLHAYVDQYPEGWDLQCTGEHIVDNVRPRSPENMAKIRNGLKKLAEQAGIAQDSQGIEQE